MPEPELLTEIDGPVARITFNRPQSRNALTAGMLKDMCEFLKQVEVRDSVRVVVMTGAGDHFMAGADIAGVTASLNAPPETRRREFETRAQSGLPVFAIMERMPQVIVSKVRGGVAGASLGWVLASDFVIASETANFVAAHIMRGVSPDGAVTWYLPRLVGLKKAKEIILLGGRLSAQQAWELDLVNRVTPDSELDAETEKLVQALAAGPGYAIGRAKQLLHQAHDTQLLQHMVDEATAFGACAATNDFVEGFVSFDEKRAPKFTGR